MVVETTIPAEELEPGLAAVEVEVGGAVRAARITQSPQHSVAVTSAGIIAQCGLPSGTSSSQNNARMLRSVSVITSPG